VASTPGLVFALVCDGRGLDAFFACAPLARALVRPAALTGSTGGDRSDGSAGVGSGGGSGGGGGKDHGSGGVGVDSGGAGSSGKSGGSDGSWLVACLSGGGWRAAGAVRFLELVSADLEALGRGVGGGSSHRGGHGGGRGGAEEEAAVAALASLGNLVAPMLRLSLPLRERLVKTRVMVRLFRALQVERSRGKRDSWVGGRPLR